MTDSPTLTGKLTYPGHVTESIFDGKIHVIPLADVIFIRKVERETSRNHYPDLESRIGVYLKSSRGPLPALYLDGDEMESFTSAWRAYRHELEKDTRYPLHTIETVQIGDMKHEITRPASSHTCRDNFEHFLAYSGYGNQTEDVQAMLWRAYAHGADSNDADDVHADGVDTRLHVGFPQKSEAESGDQPHKRSQPQGIAGKPE